MSRLRFVRRKGVWMPILGLLVVAIFVSVFRDAGADEPALPFSDVVRLAADGKVT